VVTHDVPTDVPDGPTQFTYVTDGIDSAVRQAKAVAGEKDVSIMGGASIARQALEAKLLDEIQIHLTPVILGNGIRLFDGLDTGQIRLEQLRIIEAPGVTHLKHAFTTRRLGATALAVRTPVRRSSGPLRILADY
jgi:dihydrofolate reductase